MKKFAWLIVAFLVYEQTTMNVTPCGNWQEIKSNSPSDKAFAAPACIERHVRELSRIKYKNVKEATKGKVQPEVNGFAYRIEEKK